jgi:hypothetical protein
LLHLPLRAIFSRRMSALQWFSAEYQRFLNHALKFCSVIARNILGGMRAILATISSISLLPMTFLLVFVYALCRNHQSHQSLYR